MKFPWNRGVHRQVHEREGAERHEERLERASRKIGELRDRGERVAASLEGRRARNHWGETIAAIARREH